MNSRLQARSLAHHPGAPDAYLRRNPSPVAGRTRCILARTRLADRLADAVLGGARLQPAAVRALVRRRPHQSLPQRHRPPPRDPCGPARAGFHLDRNRPAPHLYLCRSRLRGRPLRGGAIHSVVFGGFAAASLATRIDDAKPEVMVTADAGMRGGKVIPYKHLVDEALRLAKHPPT